MYLEKGSLQKVMASRTPNSMQHIMDLPCRDRPDSVSYLQPEILADSIAVTVYTVYTRRVFGVTLLVQATLENLSISSGI